MPLIWRVLDRQRVRSLREYIEMGGGTAANAAREASPDEIIGVLSSSGLRGRGGAGFPTGTKWRTVAGSRSSRDVTTVVVNAAEGEPGTFKDRALLRTNPYRVLEGAIIAATTMQSDQIRIGIKGRSGARSTASPPPSPRCTTPDGSTTSTSSSSSARALSLRRGDRTSRGHRGPTAVPTGDPSVSPRAEDDDTRSAGGVSLATTSGVRHRPRWWTTSRRLRTSRSSSSSAPTGSESSAPNGPQAPSSARSAARRVAALSVRSRWDRRFAT